MKEDLFKDYQERLNVLDENIRAVALKYAREFFSIFVTFPQTISI